jgi:hypothetical protein
VYRSHGATQRLDPKIQDLVTVNRDDLNAA